MNRTYKPETAYADAMLCSPYYRHFVHDMALTAWKEAEGYQSRRLNLAKQLLAWMLKEVPSRDSGISEANSLFLSIAINGFDWEIVAERIAEVLGMPGVK
jgi:dsDNA-binding SOS-regulon protein